MARVFLSHSSLNSAEAIAFRDWLLEQGWDDLFLDLDPERGLKAGERWQEALRRANSACEFVIFLISPAWVESKWCLAEFLQAKIMSKRIFGVIVEPTPIEDLPVEMTSEWQLVDLSIGQEKRRFPIAPPVWHKNGPTEVAFSKEGLLRLQVGLQEAGLDARFFAWPPENEVDRSPYRGLEPLEEEDAGIFFGRDGPIAELLDKLRGLREDAQSGLLVILGASGAGKSSFMRAGILPRLKRDRRNFLSLPVLRPGRAAITGETGLAAILARAFHDSGKGPNRAQILKSIMSGPLKVHSLLQQLQLRVNDDHSLATAGAPMVILPIDQGEELFGGESSEESRALLEIIATLVSAGSWTLTVLLTIRSDSYEVLQTAEPLKELRQVPFSLPPMPAGAYSEIIRAPAERLSRSGRSLIIEEQLTEALLSDLEQGDAKDALPLLAFTLERLYRDYGTDGDLRLDEYESLGRIRGAIEVAVEEALQVANSNPGIPRDPEERHALLRRGLIPWLASVDHDTGSPRRRVAPLSEIPAEARPLIDLLVEQRLLSRDRDPHTGEITLEPAHEALLRQWSVLKDWLQEDAGALVILETVKRAARDWESNERSPSWLSHTGTRLADAMAVVDRDGLSDFVKDRERSYLTAARNAEKTRQSRDKSLRRSFVVAFFLALAGFLLAGLKWQEAQQALYTETRERRAKELALGNVGRLADVKRLEAANAAAERLFPPSPKLVKELKAWQEEHGIIADRLADHRSYLAELRSKALPSSVGSDWLFEDQASQFLHDVVAELLTNLEFFATGELGPTKSVRLRLKQSQSIAHETLEGDAALHWAACFERIAANPVYHGFELAPQLGLVPLGPDRDTGLEEFLHWLTHDGDLPKRTASGQIVVTEKLGVVLVLIPGGGFLMGSQSEDPSGPNYDRDSRTDEQPVHNVSLATYLISKYEMTQAQWQRAFSYNPSRFREGYEFEGYNDHPVTDLHPVEQVSHEDALRLLPRVGLTLPTEAEWERAARAGATNWVWSGALAVAALHQFGNINGHETKSAGFMWQQFGHKDDFVRHAPVGSFWPNPYGLYDMTGNVSEWCLDGSRDSYEDRPGERGLRLDPRLSPFRVSRGGSFRHLGPDVRIASRSYDAPNPRLSSIGVRPLCLVSN